MNVTNTTMNNHKFQNSFCFAQRYVTYKQWHEQTMCKLDSRKGRSGAILHILLSLLQLTTYTKNDILNPNNRLINGNDLSNGKCMYINFCLVTFRKCM